MMKGGDGQRQSSNDNKIDVGRLQLVSGSQLMWLDVRSNTIMVR